MQNYNITFKPFGNKAVLIEWPALINEDVLKDIISYKQHIQKDFQDAEIVIAYHTLTIVFAKTINYPEIKRNLKDIYKLNLQRSGYEVSLWKLPVLYGNQLGLDMQEYTFNKNLSEQEVIALHTKPLYTVYAIGFLPGFLYLGGLDKQLHQPRKSQPRLKIPEGSVGIGGSQTGIYPQESPGGWNIIGNSPVKLFDPKTAHLCPVNVGDKVQFYPVNRHEYELIAIQVKTGVYQFKKQKYYD